MASSVSEGSTSENFARQEVGASAYLGRHSREMFEEGRSFSGNERDKLFLNQGGGSFLDLSSLSGADSPNDGRGVLALDLDDDGDQDLFVHNIQRERHCLYRNDLAGGNFLKLRLKATQGQYEAIGATVIVTGPAGPFAQVLSRGAGFVSCQAPELVFGLGAATAADVSVLWPGGARESFGRIAASSRALLVEGSGQPVAFAADPRPLPEPLPEGLRIARGQKLPLLPVLDEHKAEATLDCAALAGEGRLYLNLWASTCASCVRELPLLEKLAKRPGCAVATLSVDAPNDSDRALLTRSKKAPNLPLSFVGSTRGDIGALLDLERLPIPTTLVIDGDGVLVEILRGPIPEALLED